MRVSRCSRQQDRSERCGVPQTVDTGAEIVFDEVQVVGGGVEEEEEEQKLYELLDSLTTSGPVPL